MAIIHYDVTFEKCPSLNQIKDKSTHPYFRESALAALIDLGGNFEAKLHPYIAKRWSDLSPAEKQVGWRTH
jgi:hypothetical protein